MNRFENILSNETQNIDSLPLLHTCDAFAFRSILEELVLKPTMCDVFKTNLLYTYYGLPSYRTSYDKPTSSASNYMICFILESENTSNVSKVFPFDSGAFVKYETIKDSYFHKNTKIDDFELSGNINSAKRIIKTFYSSNENYIKQTPTQNVFPILEFEAEGYNNLISSKANSNFDDRTSSIEVLFDNEILLEKKTVKQLIIPKCFKDDVYAMELIKEKFEIETPLTYNTHRGSPREFFGLLRSEYLTFLQN